MGGTGACIWFQVRKGRWELLSRYDVAIGSEVSGTRDGTVTLSDTLFGNECLRMMQDIDVAFGSHLDDCSCAPRMDSVFEDGEDTGSVLK